MGGIKEYVGQKTVTVERDIAVNSPEKAVAPVSEKPQESFGAHEAAETRDVAAVMASETNVNGQLHQVWNTALWHSASGMMPEAQSYR